ncbi:Electron transfer flavoprotein subunit alpha mitochondrial [Zea mays]|uniref:Electron transfer flavoprotein subunit alpha mitochondrial n=1 Tax=Zea mays TaxID=4577 RepID=K7VNY3_MAIZE|nr:Electron transfer flavoprotein subunit alpha mitochondrial [Zea mays]AQK89431.1 Electron transfer flavoprotein subunit alpha mitochondrial [Zea mays]AQK89432.1 Electron transfer flavoprotein subunit alpha mitochondrial [Zea mays]AQK89433.1 Electron transfer flavoprotein subunit alpha mitochondrial [Zea mays]AQK89436.1 Electron transfer flavoprotein subunit alpha mitochondrial [Zea mays]
MCRLQTSSSSPPPPFLGGHPRRCVAFQHRHHRVPAPPSPVCVPGPLSSRRPEDRARPPEDCSLPQGAGGDAAASGDLGPTSHLIPLQFSAALELLSSAFRRRVYSCCSPLPSVSVVCPWNAFILLATRSVVLCMPAFEATTTVHTLSGSGWYPLLLLADADKKNCSFYHPGRKVVS